MLKKRRLNLTTKIVGCLVLFFAVQFAVLSFFQFNASRLAAAPAAAQPPGPDRVDVVLSVLGFDPIKGELDARLEFEPQGTFSLNQGPYPNQDLKLSVNSLDKSGSEIPFDAGKLMVAPSVKFATNDGDANEYPFDRHEAEAYFYLETVPDEDAKGDAADPEDVPMVVQTIGSIPGFDISFEADAEDNSPQTAAFEITITRSPTVIFFSIVVMTIMWVLSIIAFSLAIVVLRSGKMPETGALGFLAALLFAFPAIRNAQPGAPPVGATSDFLSFFWTEIIVVIALAIIGSTWLIRYTKTAK